jgi:beta-mannosidase
MGGAQDPFGAGWQALVTDKGQYQDPGQLPATGWIPAPVPGTIAEALAAQGLAPVRLADHDVWYRCALNEMGPRQFAFEGLTPLAQVWLDDRLILESHSMFVRHEVEAACGGRTTLTVRFTALIIAPPPRARWRAKVIPDQSRRAIRATLLGQMPSWTPDVEAIGPWRAITCRKPNPVELVKSTVVATRLEPGGKVEVELTLRGAANTPVLACGGQYSTMRSLGDGRFTGDLDLPEVAAWWPHTHGPQPLYGLTVTAGDTVIELGRIGFRDIRVDRNADGKGFGLVVNGEAVFCRGANWVSADALGLKGGRDIYEPLLHLAREAGMNMLRLSGVGAYETADFYDLCDELGILVWQDFMFCCFDYPIGDPAFADLVEREARDLFGRLGASPCLAVLCGASETEQQAAMWGLPAERTRSALTEELLPRICAEHRPDAIYVRNSPTGGALPFVADEGVTHYYGVGAYRRPIEDARRADVRFASECLGLANLPQPSMVLPALDSPDWDATIPRDVGADWTFEDARDVYLAALFGEDAKALRRDEPGRYLDLSRAVSAEVMAQIFAEWRRPASSCQGGLVWTLQDLTPGSGYGVIDSTGEPKPAWYGLKRALQPVQINLTDEGVNGLAIHLINETSTPLDLELDLRCLRNGAVSVVKARRPVRLEPRSAVTLSAFEVLGAFLDITYAYRFGPPGHDATVAALRQLGTGEILAQAFHFPAGVKTDLLEAPKLQASLVQDQDGWALVLKTNQLVRHLHIDDNAFRPDDDWFTLAPGFGRTIKMTPRLPSPAKPTGRILAPGGGELVKYG